MYTYTHILDMFVYTIHKCYYMPYIGSTTNIREYNNNNNNNNNNKY